MIAAEVEVSKIKIWLLKIKIKVFNYYQNRWGGVCGERRTKVGLADINEEAKENALRVRKCGRDWNY